MKDNIRAVRNFKKLGADEVAHIRKRSLQGAGLSSGPGPDYCEKQV